MSDVVRDDTPRWYVVHTYSGYENKVASSLQLVVDKRNDLQDLIQEIRVPTEKVTEMKNGVKHEVERKVFPGYVLVKMVLTDDTWYIVRNIRGCTGFVGPKSVPIPLSDQEIMRLGVDQSITIEMPYEVGATVKVVKGYFEGHVGVVTEIDFDNDRVCVDLSVQDKQIPSEMSLDMVVPID